MLRYKDDPAGEEGKPLIPKSLRAEFDKFCERYRHQLPLAYVIQNPQEAMNFLVEAFYHEKRRAALFREGRYAEAFEGIDSTDSLAGFIKAGVFPKKALDIFMRYDLHAQKTLEAYKALQEAKAGGKQKGELRKLKGDYSKLRQEEIRAFRKYCRTFYQYDTEHSFKKIKSGVGIVGRMQAAAARRRIRKSIKVKNAVRPKIP